MGNGLVNCKKCGKLFFSNSSREVCDECYMLEVDIIDHIVQFVNEKDITTIDEIAENVDTDRDEIIDLISRGKLLRALPKISIKCRFCGKELDDDEKTSFTCKSCLYKFAPESSTLKEKEERKEKEEKEKQRRNNRQRANTISSQERYGFIKNFSI